MPRTPKSLFRPSHLPPSHICHTTVDYDSAIRESLKSIVGGALSDWSWLKASLPNSRGGLNLRSAYLHAPAAFLASSSGSQPLVEQILGHPPGPPPHIRSALSALASAAVHPDWQSLDDIDVPLHQHSLSLSIDDASFQRLLYSTPFNRSRALAHSSSLPHAGDWLNVVPSASLGLHLQDCEFQCYLRYWLGVPLNSNPFPCPECRSITDSFGDHQIRCGGNGDRIFQHNAIRDVVFSAAQSAALAPSKETVWSLVLSFAQQTSSSLTGAVVILLPLTFTSSALSSSRP